MDIKQYQNALLDQAFVPDRQNCYRRYKEDSAITGETDPLLNDYARLLGSTALRRLAGKTQVFFAPENPHVRTRRIHTDEVVAFGARTAQILGLNQSLVLASCLGHDIGHTPFGHLGEKVISQITGHSFSHAKFSVLVAQKIGRNGHGYNLTNATLKGILSHSSEEDKYRGQCPEYQLICLADTISYTIGDVRDILRYGLFSKNDLPSEIWSLGEERWHWIEKAIYALVKESAEEGKISFEKSETAKMIWGLKEWMYERVYLAMDVGPHEKLLKEVFEFIQKSPIFVGYDPVVLFAFLTDNEVMKIFNLLLTKPWQKIVKEDLWSVGAVEAMTVLRPELFNFTDPDLEW